MTEIRPFTAHVPDAAIADLHQRLDLVRWPERETVGDWTQGVPLAAMQELVRYWRQEYDWRGGEARFNAHPQFVTEIDGLDIHFIHVRSPHPHAMPLILTHGWPGSVVEFLEVIGPLTDPPAHGGRAEDAFHVVVPSLPGYGFSGKPAATGWGGERIGRAWAELMRRLGYTRWFAQGGDWGSIVTTAMGGQAPDGLAGIHVNLPIGRPTAEDRLVDTPEVRAALAAGAHYASAEAGYSTQQKTRPQTIGYGLVDSPVALAAWIYEKMWAWTDNDGRPEDALSLDTILDNITLYWMTGAGASAARLYWESFGGVEYLPVALPSAVSNFPKEITKAPRAWAERLMTNLVYWGETTRGGHFAAWEEPDLFVEEVRKAFALMR